MTLYAEPDDRWHRPAFVFAKGGLLEAALGEVDVVVAIAHVVVMARPSSRPTDGSRWPPGLVAERGDGFGGPLRGLSRSFRQVFPSPAPCLPGRSSTCHQASQP